MLLTLTWQVFHALNPLTSPLNSLCCFAANQLTVCMYCAVSGFCGTELPTVLLVLIAGILHPGSCFLFIFAQTHHRLKCGSLFEVCQEIANHKPLWTIKPEGLYLSHTINTPHTHYIYTMYTHHKFSPYTQHTPHTCTTCIICMHTPDIDITHT